MYCFIKVNKKNQKNPCKNGHSSRAFLKLLRNNDMCIHLNQQYQQMECSICFEQYDTLNHIPMVYGSCGHSCCRICIEGCQQTTLITCPFCRVISNSVFRNYALVDALDNKKHFDLCDLCEYVIARLHRFTK